MASLCLSFSYSYSARRAVLVLARPGQIEYEYHFIEYEYESYARKVGNAAPAGCDECVSVFRKPRPIYRQPVSAGSSFEVGQVIHVVHRWRLAYEERALEFCKLVDHLQRLLVVIEDIRPEMERARGLESSLDIAKRFFIEHPTLFVPRLPPWIGEVHMDRIQ